MKRIKPVKRYKFLREGLKSENGGTNWKIGKWQKVEGELSLCNWGFHACKDPYNAFSYVQGEILAIVECRGEYLEEEDKECYREQRVKKVYRWTKKDSVKLAIYSAELVLGNFEKEYPNDMRPRQAIEAAKKVLFEDTEESRSAAESARSAAESAAWSARSATWSAAESAAESAAWSARSARSAARSAAWSAARSAAWSARSATWSAARSARSAARSAMIEKIQKYFMKLVKELEEL